MSELEYNTYINYGIYQKIYNIAEVEKNIVIDEINNVLNRNNKACKIDKIESRIKSYNSIIDKMKNKGYKLDLNNMLEKINDIIGIRLVCSNLNDVYDLVKCIKNNSKFAIINEKDYISRPKKSGYMSYHIIIQCELETIPMRAEIQLRTREMDMWANLSHDLIYKKLERY